MGTWGTGPLENDVALDWVQSAIATQGYTAFETVFSGLDDTYLELDDGQAIVAAGEILLACFGESVANIPDDVSGWLETAEQPPTKLLRYAQKAVKRVFAADSELLEVWHDSSPDFSSWRNQLGQIVKRLKKLEALKGAVSKRRTKPRRRRVKPALGDVVAIPVDSERTVLAQILFLSSYFKKVALYGLLPTEPQSTHEVPDQITYIALEYGSTESIRLAEWHVVGTTSVVVGPECSRRIVGGDVWVGDEHIGPASDNDRSETLQMSVCGDGALVKAFSGYFSDEMKSAFQKRREAKSASFLRSLLSRG